ncbi:mannosyltransferase [Ophidiomyces ophidiicola]|nr:mannosyltransferase [Ophidiomyces ophidiicola]KAI1943456.1 mannosyltransferase [Ophidiomyces ophidiicola]KAI1964170.1 mannosyltransferase [Ophidiomyces ophidiicola]
MYRIWAVPFLVSRLIESGIAQLNLTRQLSPSNNTIYPEVGKYFHEPGSDDILGHYDVRYFNGVVSYQERTHTLTHMIGAYLQFFRENKLDTWIAHGTLLGWWWNEKILPWDWDIDAQVTGMTLEYMSRNFNRTIYTYSPNEKTIRKYLLDVNPRSEERGYGDGLNIIDARWIDVRNGLYIDITALSELDPALEHGIVACKNFHKYNISDLFPMRQGTFEGVPANIPFKYNGILTEEYGEKALIEREYQK